MSVPFFSDFSKKSKDFFKKSEYDLGKQVHVKTTMDEHSVTAKLNVGANPTAKVVGVGKLSWGSLEVTEDLKSGLTLDVKVPKFYKNIDFTSKHRRQDVEMTFKYKGSNGYWNTKFLGKYVPNNGEGDRVCTAKASIAVGDDRLVKVGGEIEFEDSAKAGVFPTQLNLASKSYALGFLYEPTDDSALSLIYSPDPDSNGLKYDFQLYKGCSENCHLAAQATGPVETKLSSPPPVLAVGGGWKVGGNYCQGYLNSVKEYGVSYKTKLAPHVTCTLGFGRWREANKFADPRGREPVFKTTFGYKFVLN